jgi:hypothetical protein
MKRISFATTLELDVMVEGTGDPGYEPYETQNHDDPRFSDPGANAEIDEYKVMLGGIDITKELSKQTIEEIESQFYDELAEDDDDFDSDIDYDERDDDDWLEQARDELEDEDE